MSRSIPLYAPRNGCFHSNVFEDYREGTVICLECALVLEENVSETFFDSAAKEEILKNEEILIKTTQEREKLMDIADIWNIPLSEVNTIMNHFNRLLHRLKQSKYRRNEILAYATYTHIIKNSYCFSPQDIAHVFDLAKINILFKIQTEVNEIIIPQIEDFSNKFCSLLSLTYKEKVFISRLCVSQFHFYSHLHPKSLSIIIIINFCKLYYPSLNLLVICKTCSSSSRNILSIMKREKKLVDGILNECKLFKKE